MATQKKTWEQWRWGGVGILTIYSEGFSRSCWESQQLLLKPVPNSGDFWPGTSGGSIRREVVCGLPVNPKQKKTMRRQRLHLTNPPSETYSGMNAICFLWTKYWELSTAKYLLWKRLLEESLFKQTRKVDLCAMTESQYLTPWERTVFSNVWSSLSWYSYWWIMLLIPLVLRMLSRDRSIKNERLQKEEELWGMLNWTNVFITHSIPQNLPSN